MRFIVKVGRKGQVVIPAEIRRKYGIKNKVVIRADEDGVKIVPVISLEEMFGIDGEVMKDIAKEIVKERLEEMGREKEIRY